MTCRRSLIRGVGRALLVSLAPAGAAAQEDAPASWSATLHYEAIRIAPAPDAAFWHAVTAGVARRVAGGSVALQAVATRRFDVEDRGLVLDAYHTLWRGAYGNVRLGIAPGAETMSRHDVGGEVFQAIGSSELSGSVRRQGFEATEVSSVGVGMGHYVGNWYLRPRTVIAHVDGAWAPFGAFTVRRYLSRGVDRTVDVTVGMGEEVLEVQAPVGDTRRLNVLTSGSLFAGVGTRLFFGRHLGATAGVNYSVYETIPDRWVASVGVLTRW